jgi:hypothetical protein
MKKKIVGILICMLVIAIGVIPVVGSMNIKQLESKTVYKQYVQPPLPSWILELINGDWNYWSNAPNMFSIPMGNVGIGTNTPDRKLEVFGDMRITNPSDPNDYLDIVVNNMGTGLTHIVNGGHVGQSVILDGSGGLSAESVDAWFGFTAETGSVIVKQGKIGVGITNPVSKLHVIGKATITGGVDPPYVSFSKESHNSIREFAKDVEDHEEVMQFWNGDSHRMEIYDISEDVFYTLTGEVIVE